MSQAEFNAFEQMITDYILARRAAGKPEITREQARLLIENIIDYSIPSMKYVC